MRNHDVSTSLKDLLAEHPAGGEAVGQFSLVAGINETGKNNGRPTDWVFSWFVFIETTPTMTSIYEQFSSLNLKISHFLANVEYTVLWYLSWHVARTVRFLVYRGQKAVKVFFALLIFANVQNYNFKKIRLSYRVP